jgi:23S rRNA (guanine2445-N2)-methyltransferase / 23S rRNA (guanine2069-N7)-methyltransferase
LDLSGEALHLRGRGRDTGRAPIKETLASALLRLMGWPELARQGAAFSDPMCGAATILSEAAGMALDHAPGLDRGAWGFSRWKGHEARTWERLLSEARDRRRTGRERRLVLEGADQGAAVLEAARSNLKALGLLDRVRLQQRSVGEARPPAEAPGLVLSNPPYGVRLGEEEELVGLYRSLGDVLRQRFLGYRAGLITGSPRLAGSVGLKPARRFVVYNGPIECRLLRYDISTESPRGQPRWRQEQEAR